MGALAHQTPPSSSMPPAWTSWLNFAPVPDPRSTDSTWSWQPPATRDGMNTPAKKSDRRSARKVIDWSQKLSECHDLEAIRALYWQTCPSGEHATRFSKEACLRILRLADQRAATPPSTSASKQAMKMILEFLNSDVNNTHAHNLLMALEWCNDRAWSLHRSRLSLMYVIEAQLRHLDPAEVEKFIDPAVRLITTLFDANVRLANKAAVSLVTSLREVLQRAPLEHKSSMVACLIRFLDAMPLTRATLELRISTVGLWSVQSCREWSEKIQSWLLQATTKDRETASKLDLGHALRRGTQLIAGTSDSSLKVWWEEVLWSIDHVLGLQESQRGNELDLQWWRRSIQSVREYCENEECAKAEDKNPFETSRLFDRSDLGRHSNNSEYAQQSPLEARTGVSSSVSEIQHEHQNEMTVRNSRISTRIRRTLQRAAAAAEVAALISKVDVDLAKQHFFNHRSIDLVSCEKLIHLLIDHGHYSLHTYNSMLRRKSRANRVPISQRDDEANSLSPQYIDLVERVATSASQSEALGEIGRHQMRRVVWLCYRYLADRRAPIPSGLSQAMLKAGITRYLEEGWGLPAARFNAILDKLRKSEGHDVADMVQKVASEWRREIANGLKQKRRQEILQ